MTSAYDYAIASAGSNLGGAVGTRGRYFVDEHGHLLDVDGRHLVISANRNKVPIVPVLYSTISSANGPTSKYLNDLVPIEDYDHRSLVDTSATGTYVPRSDPSWHIGNYQFNDLTGVSAYVNKNTNLSISASSRLGGVTVESGGYLNLTKVSYTIFNSLFTKWIDRLALKAGAIVDFPAGTTSEIALTWLGDTPIDGVVTKIHGVLATFKPEAKPPAPSEKLAIGASHASPTSVSLNWNAAAGATGYNLYQASSSAGSYQLIASNTPNLSAAASGLATGSYYWFKAAAVDAKGEIAVSDPIQVRARPLRPASINAAPGSKTGSVKVSWGSVAECDGYAVYVSTSRTGAYTLKSVVSGRNSLSAQVTGLKSGATYYFKVASYVQVGPAKVPSVYTGVVSAKAK